MWLREHRGLLPVRGDFAWFSCANEPYNGRVTGKGAGRQTHISGSELPRLLIYRFRQVRSDGRDLAIPTSDQLAAGSLGHTWPDRPSSRHLAWRRMQVGLRPLSGRKDVSVAAIRKGLAHT